MVVTSVIRWNETHSVGLLSTSPRDDLPAKDSPLGVLVPLQFETDRKNS
jgi:hypothetical protein